MESENSVQELPEVSSAVKKIIGNTRNFFRGPRGYFNRVKMTNFDWKRLLDVLIVKQTAIWGHLGVTCDFKLTSELLYFVYYRWVILSPFAFSNFYRLQSVHVYIKCLLYYKIFSWKLDVVLSKPTPDRGCVINSKTKHRLVSISTGHNTIR